MQGPAARRLLVLAIAAGFAAIFVRLAWVSDDAYITLRSVENLATGNGLRWNAVDRVQTFRFVMKGVELGSADVVPVADGVAPTSQAQVLSRLLGVREVDVAVPAGVEGFETIWVDLFALPDNAPGPAALGCVTLGA